MSSSPPPQRKRKRHDTVVSDASDNDFDSSHVSQPAGASALSHAERRRQKKKAKLVVKAPKSPELTSDVKNRAGAATKKIAIAAHSTRQNSVWVGNLSFRTTTDALRTFFDGVGEITRINMPTKPGGKDICGSALILLRMV
jgi:RNA recognition motif-containing protein